jgi:protein SCO1/2
MSWPPYRCAIPTLAVVCLLCATSQAQLRTKEIVQEVGIDQHLDAQLPLDAVLVDESGRSVRLGDFFHDGKPVIVTFVYFRCPMLCTQVLNGLLQSSQAVKLRMNEDYHVLSISIDPRETPAMATAKKRKYVASYRRPGAEEGWHFLTADSATVDRLTSIAGFRYRYDEASDQYAHASGLIVATPEGRISHYLYGIDFAPNDLRLALVDSSENRIGSLVDQVLLLCYHYDPATGKYGLAISAVMKIAGIATMILLGGYLTRMYRLERQRSHLLSSGIRENSGNPDGALTSSAT